MRIREARSVNTMIRRRPKPSRPSVTKRPRCPDGSGPTRLRIPPRRRRSQRRACQCSFDSWPGPIRIAQRIICTTVHHLQQPKRRLVWPNVRVERQPEGCPFGRGVRPEPTRSLRPPRRRPTPTVTEAWHHTAALRGVGRQADTCSAPAGCSSPATRISQPATGPRRSHSATLRRLSISLMATARPAFRSDAPA